MPRPLSIAVGSRDDASSAEGTGDLELTAETGDLAAGDTAGSAELGELTVATTFYFAEILSAEAMANARESLATLPHDKRVAQTCNIEAVGQVGNAGRGFAPDAVIADALSKSLLEGTRVLAAGAIFRSEQKWYALWFDCTLSADLTEIAAFSFRIGPDVTALVTRAQ
jgi:hypothetical protein